MRLPKLRRHKTGQAHARIGGKDHYFGVWPKSQRTPPTQIKQLYEAKLAEWLVSGKPRLTIHGVTTIGAIMAQYWLWATKRYEASRTELRDIKHSLPELRKLHESTPLSHFNLTSLETVRQCMIDVGRPRKLINQRIGRIKRMFHWAAQRKLISVELLHELLLLKNLRPGESAARETKPVTGVDPAIVNLTLPHVSIRVAAMIRLQQWTGMRPGEVTGLRWDMIDASHEPWTSKFNFKRKARVVFLGGKSRFLLSQWKQDHGSDGFIFSHRGGKRVHVRNYYKAIAKACKKANAPHWHPHQLRHSAATQIQLQVATEALKRASLTLGHGGVQITKTYAHGDLEIAAKIAELMG